MTDLDEKPWQVLESVEADFEKMTWTFGIGAGNRVSAGHYVVMPTDFYADLTGRLATAEGLLKRHLNGEGGNSKFNEQVLRYFDPKPL